MSDEDDVDDIDAEQDELDREEDDKELEDWDEYRKEAEEVSEEVRAWLRSAPGARAHPVGSGRGMTVFAASCSGCPRPSRRS